MYSAKWDSLNDNLTYLSPVKISWWNIRFVFPENPSLLKISKSWKLKVSCFICIYTIDMYDNGMSQYLFIACSEYGEQSPVPLAKSLSNCLCLNLVVWYQILYWKIQKWKLKYNLIFIYSWQWRVFWRTPRSTWRAPRKSHSKTCVPRTRREWPTWSKSWLSRSTETLSC